MPLELEHIDGDNKNNIRDNLEALCPNCHALTTTWRGRNKRSGNRITKVPDIEIYNAWLETGNVRQALLKVGMAAKGGNYTRVYRIIKEFDEELN